MWPLRQTFPTEPQLLISDCVLIQVVPEQLVPAEQLQVPPHPSEPQVLPLQLGVQPEPQVPLEQTSPPAHPPQLSLIPFLYGLLVAMGTGLTLAKAASLAMSRKLPKNIKIKNRFIASKRSLLYLKYPSADFVR